MNRILSKSAHFLEMIVPLPLSNLLILHHRTQILEFCVTFGIEVEADEPGGGLGEDGGALVEVLLDDSVGGGIALAVDELDEETAL